MTRFNTRVKGSTRTTNHEGATAYTLTPELELYSLAATSLLSDKFYENANENTKRLQALIKQVRPEFAAKLAVYAREQMHLRSLPLVLAVELGKIHNGDSLVARTVRRVVSRADELAELLGYYAQANNRSSIKKLGKLSKQIQKGLSDAFNKFDEYQFGKYNRDGGVKLRDALFIVHPKAKDAAQQTVFDKIATNTLATPDTWEVELSASSDKKSSWERLIEENKLGYMALLRNLRNILEADVSNDHLAKVCEKLSNMEEVARSKQFPFRFLSAYREVQDVAKGRSSMVLDALEEAVIAAAQNIRGFDYNTKVLIASDVSGSMQTPVSARSKVMLYDVGLMLSMLLQSKSKNVQTGIFGDTWKIKNFPKTGVLGNVQKMRDLACEVGMSTNGHLVIEDLINRGEVVDKVMIFTDMQLWDSTAFSTWGGLGGKSLSKVWPAYKKIAPNAKLYLFDLAGYGKTPLTVKSGGAYLIAGWSDRVFDMLAAYERGSDAVEEINQITL